MLEYEAVKTNTGTGEGAGVSESVDSRVDQVLARETSADFSAVELYKELSDGRLWVDLYTDSSSSETNTDNDYLAGGIWIYVPDDANSLDDFEYGAFVDGNDPYPQDELVRVVGSAEFTGAATGVLADRSAGENTFFDAKVTLNMDWGSNSELGTISGTISEFEEDGILIDNSPMLTLMGPQGNTSANIGTDNSGFFTGDTVTSFNGETYTGKWGGQFYGGFAGFPPGSAAGTFGGATGTGDSAKSFIGAFGAFD